MVNIVIEDEGLKLLVLSHLLCRVVSSGNNFQGGNLVSLQQNDIEVRTGQGVASILGKAIIPIYFLLFYYF